MDQNNEPRESTLFEDHVEYVTASTGTRFFNWLIDFLVMRFGLNYATGTGLGYLIGNFFPDYARSISEDKDRGSLLLLALLLVIFNYLLYYTICEKAFRGYTLGKIITGSRAIREDGKELTFKDALLRSLCRLIPFEVFSGFARKPWHDSLTNTTVIQVR